MFSQVLRKVRQIPRFIRKLQSTFKKFLLLALSQMTYWKYFQQQLVSALQFLCIQSVKSFKELFKILDLGLSLLLYSLFKLVPRMYYIENGTIYKQESNDFLKKLTKMIEGAIIGFITGFVLIPLFLAIVIKLIDGRLQINKNALFMKQLKILYVPLLPFIIIGILLGKLVIFLDITLLKVILILFTYFAIIFFYAEKIEEQQKNNINDFRGSQIIKDQNHKFFQILENIIIGYYLFAYSCLDYLNIWVCLAYVGWVLISDKVNAQYWFNFQQLKVQQNKQQSIDQIFQSLTCPILSVNMENPYAVKQCGHTFQKQNLAQTLKIRISCPLCNVRSASQNIIPNLKVKQINEYLKNQRKGEDQSCYWFISQI